ncbi:hypothetical protein RIF29_20097 [Crotalaria pallida]|uniref:Uncharacterized protein n=1 Tax=Crotalaria pallida TaxID=3830 RepID=A0AAN9F908_CROPI
MLSCKERERGEEKATAGITATATTAAANLHRTQPNILDEIVVEKILSIVVFIVGELLGFVWYDAWIYRCSHDEQTRDGVRSDAPSPPHPSVVLLIPVNSRCSNSEQTHGGANSQQRAIPSSQVRLLSNHRSKYLHRCRPPKPQRHDPDSSGFENRGQISDAAQNRWTRRSSMAAAAA